MLDLVLNKLGDTHFLAVLLGSIGCATTVIMALLPFLQASDQTVKPFGRGGGRSSVRTALRALARTVRPLCAVVSRMQRGGVGLKGGFLIGANVEHIVQRLGPFGLMLANPILHTVREGVRARGAGGGGVVLGESACRAA